jgi:hypothetical protein
MKLYLALQLRGWRPLELPPPPPPLGVSNDAFRERERGREKRLWFLLGEERGIVHRREERECERQTGVWRVREGEEGDEKR